MTTPTTESLTQVETVTKFANMATNYQDAKEAGTPAHLITPDSTTPKTKGTPGRPRKYANAADSAKAYRARVTKLQANVTENVLTLSSPILMSALKKHIAALHENTLLKNKGDMTEHTRLAGIIMKELKRRFKIKFVLDAEPKTDKS